MSSGAEKRKLPRLLCKDGFSSIKLNFGDQDFELKSIDYTHEGIALFNSEELPEIDDCTISFSFDIGNEAVKITQLPCTLVHVNDAGSGLRYGAAFKLEAANSAQIEDLIRIEEHVALGLNKKRS